MAESELKIKVKVNNDGKLEILKGDLSAVGAAGDKAASAVNRLSDRIKLMGHTAVAVALAKTSIIDSARAGVQYNATLEQTQLALKATISGYIDAATGAERIAAAEAMAIAQMEALKVSALETGVGFGDLSSAFKTFLPGALSVGMSMDKATKAAARLTQAAKIQGVEFGALLAGIDGVAKGTILANSDFGRFLSGLGLTNEALKEAANSGQTYELIMSKLADIPAVAAEGANGYNASLAALGATIDQLRGELTKPLFNQIAESAKGLNEFLTANRAALIKAGAAVTSFGKAAGAGAAAYIAFKIAVKSGAITAATTALKHYAFAASLFGARIATAAAAQTAFAAATKAAGAAFKSTPWGIVIAGLSAVAYHLISAKNAAAEAAEAFDGTAKSIENLTANQTKKLRKDLLGELEAAEKSYKTFRDTYSSKTQNVDILAELDSRKAAMDKAFNRLKELTRAEEELRSIAAKPTDVNLRAFNPEEGARLLKELQAERDKAVFTELEKLEAKRQEMVDQLVAKVAPDSEEFRKSIILIGEIYSAELQKINEKTEADRKKLIENINGDYAKATKSEADRIQAQFAAAREEAIALISDTASLADVIAKLNEMEGVELAKLKRAEYQKIIDEAVRANNAIKEIESLGIDNAVLRNEITEEEANRKKQLLAYDTEILNIEKQIASLNPASDGVRISELEKTRALLTEQKELTAKEIIPSDLQKSIADSFANAITDGLLKGLENGKLDAKSILGDIAGGLSQSFANELNKSLSNGISTMMSGGGFGGFNPASMAASAAASVAMGVISSELNARWEVTDQRDLLQEIADNTKSSVEAFKAYFALVKRYGAGDLTPFAALTAVMRDASMSGEGGYKLSDLSKFALGGGLFQLVGSPIGVIDALFGGKLGGSITGALESVIGSLFGYNKTSRKGYDSSLGTAKFLEVTSSADQYLKAAREYLLGWFDDYYDNFTKFNVEVGRETSKKKSLLGTKTKTTIFYTQLTEAQLMLSAFLKQFGTDKYGSLTTEGAKVFNEKMGALLAVTEGIDALVAAIEGRSTEYNLQASRAALSNATEYIAAIYNDALENAGISLIETIIGDAGESYQALKDLSAAELAKSFENLDLRAIIGKYGAAINADDLTAALESLRQAVAANIEAVKAYANAELDRISSEASFIEFLNAADSAIESAASSLRSFAEGLKSFAKQARDLAASAHSEDKEYLQRQYLTARLAYSNLYDDTGAIRGNLSQQYIQDVMSGYLDAARSFQGSIGDYDFTTQSALERELLAAADAVDLSADILSVKIVGDNIDLATNQTINDLIAALTPALSLDQIGFTGTSDAAKRALALASGVKTSEELDNLVEAIATLRFGDDLSDAAYLDNLALLAENDANAARQAELLQRIAELLERDEAINMESLKRLDALKRNSERVEAIAEAGL
jgi:hypothetical protein